MGTQTIIRLFSLLLCLLLSASCATLAGVDEPDAEYGAIARTSTAPYDTYVKGRPDGDLRAQGGLYIWRTADVWSVRLAKKIDRLRPQLTHVGPVVSGSILLEDATLVELRKQKITQFNDVQQTREGVSFRFQLRDDYGNDIEGFDFKAVPTGLDYCVVLDILVDGIPNPGMVRLGSYQHILDRLPLRICQRSFDDAIKIKPKPKK